MVMFKVDGLSERDLRLPRTPTGTNLLGVVKHLALVEVGCLGNCLGRPWEIDVWSVMGPHAETMPTWCARRRVTRAGPRPLSHRLAA